MPLIEGPSLGGNARHVLRQYAEENALARERTTNAAGNEEFGGGCLRGRYNNLRETIQPTPSIVVVPSLINAGGLFVQRPVCRTNYLVNNAMLGATGSVLPSGWSIGTLPLGLTASYSASGQTTAADGTVVDYIDFTLSGTAAASGFFNLRPNASTSTIVATSGQTWNTSVFLALVSGSVATVAPTWQLQETTSGGTFLQGSNISGLASLVSGGALERYNVSRTLTDGATERVQVRWGHSLASGTAYNYTIRIGSPQLERLDRVTPMIRTGVSVTGAVTVLNESSNVIGLPPDFTVTRATSATRVNEAGLIESVASGVPRIDWLGQSCPALLVEPASTNFARFVQQLTAQDTPAASGGMTITTGSTDFLAPDGASGSITKYVGGAASGESQYAYYAGGGIVVTAAGQHTFSLFVKAGATNPLNFCALRFALYTGGSGTDTSYFSLASGTALTAGASIQDYGNGWYRLISAPYTIASGDLSGQLVFIMAEANGDVTWPASGALNLTAYIWGAQLETGSVATTYIPTTTGSATRNADQIVASGALVSGLIGQAAGTIYCEFAYFGTPTNRSGPIYLRQENTRGQSINFAPTSSPTGLVFISRNNGGQDSINLVSGALQIGTYYKIAIGYDASGTAAGGSQASGVVAYVNGVQVGIGTFRVPDAVISEFRMYGANAGTGDAEAFNGRIRATALYTTRLSNEQLAQLTRL